MSETIEANVGVRSGKVMTVLGPIAVEKIGVTLTHEHILLDASSWWKRPCCGSEIGLAERPIDVSMLGDLRMNPFLNRDNCQLLDVDAAVGNGPLIAGIGKARVHVAEHGVAEVAALRLDHVEDAIAVPFPAGQMDRQRHAGQA